MSDVRRLAVRGFLEDCLGRERDCQARFLESLGEFDSQRWFAFEACSSSFRYLTERLKLCGNAAWRRLTTARAARRFPVILEMIRDGRVHMTGISIVSKLLDESNASELLAAIVGKSKREIEQLVADMNPREPRDSRTGKCTSPRRRAEGSEPLGDGYWKIELYADADLKTLIDEAMELAVPGTDLASIVRDALAVYVRRKRTRKFGAEVGVGASNDAGGEESVVALERSRYVPASVRRAVFERDGGQCSFVDEVGRRCSERRGLEFDHVEPFCLGGEHSVGNLRLLCSAHNRHVASEILGVGFMGRWIGGVGGGLRR